MATIMSAPPMVGVPASKGGLGTILAHRLADLVPGEAANHHRPHEQGIAEGGEHGQNGPQGKVLKHREAGIKRLQPGEQPKKHG